MARFAYALKNQCRFTNAQARNEISQQFKVSVTTAKRLISRGAFLALQERHDAN